MGSRHEGTQNTASAGENVVQAHNVHGDVHIHGPTSPAENAHVVPRQLPATVRHFINRAVERDALTTLLNGAGSDHTLLLSTIDGLAGVGKSTLVVEWAHHVREQFPDGDLYINLRGFDPAAEPVAPAEALAGFLTSIGIAQDALPATEEARAAQFRTLVHGRRMLLVLDNARDAEHVLPLLPGSPTCLVVVTSRQRLDGLVAHHGAQRLTLTTLTNNEGHQLLARYLGAERLSEEPDAAAALLEHCAGLPLALTLVAAQAAAEPDVPLEEFAADLRAERDSLDALDVGGRTGIRAVFSWSYRTLSPDAAYLFRLLGLPNSPTISLGAATALAGMDQRRTRRTLAELCRAHLLTRHAGDRYVFHDLLRAYARERAHHDDAPEERTAALHRLLDHYLRATCNVSKKLTPTRPMPDLDYAEQQLWHDFQSDEDALAWWEAEYASVLAMIRQAVMLGMKRGHWLAYAATNPFKLRGLLDELHLSAREGIKGAEAQGDGAAQARLLMDLGTAHYLRGEPNEAIRHQQAAAEHFAELGEHSWEALMHTLVGDCLLEAGRYAEAARSARKALATQQKSDSQLLDAGMNDLVLGLALAHLGDFSEAFAHLHRAVEIGEDQTRALAFTNLGTAYLLADDVENAVRTYQRAVAHRRATNDRVGEGTSLNKLGEALLAGGHTESAQEIWQEALAILDEFRHPEAETVRSHLDTLDLGKSR